MSEKFYKLVDGILWADWEHPKMSEYMIHSTVEEYEDALNKYNSRPHYPLSETLVGKERYELGVDFEVRHSYECSLNWNCDCEPCQLCPRPKSEPSFSIAIPIAQPVPQNPYLADFKYNKDYGDDRICICGHPYYRHFDTYEDMATVGCKYCFCYEFIELKEGEQPRDFNKEASEEIIDSEQPVEGEKKDELQTGLWNEVGGIIKNAIGLDPYRVAKIIDYLKDQFTLTKK